MPLRLYGIIMQDGHVAAKLPQGLQLQPLRELAAITEDGDYRPGDVDAAEVERHLAIVSGLYRAEPVLPAPVGTTFRSTEVLQKWMELHYVALSDALAWVEDRLGARVHITRAMGKESDKEAGSDLAAIAAQVTRSLRRHAVSTVPLRNEEVTGIVLSAAYLVERELWEEFADSVDAEADAHPTIRLELTGPWPPYDFVKIQFGA